MKTARLVCTVAGRPLPILAVDAAHGVDQPVGTATLTLPVPLDPAVALNATAEVQAGYDETTIRTIFTGRVVTTHRELTDSGPVARVDCAGWASLLAFPDNADLIYANSSSLYGIFRSLCQRRGVPAYQADYVRFPDGVTDVRLGGQPLVDGGNVIIPRDSSPLDWLVTKAKLFGYRTFDRPDGVVMLQRVSGSPAATTATYVEAVDLLSLSHDDDLSTMTTYWEVLGARYTDANGVNVAIRSIPSVVPYSAVLDPPGYRKTQLNDSGLVSIALADAARNVAEIDAGAPGLAESFEIEADPTLQPGLSVHLTSASLGVDGPRWLMALHQTLDDGGYWATADVWAGGGMALPAGNDCVSIALGTGPYHLGDEYISWYAAPNPAGHTLTLPFTADKDYTSMTVYGRAHGCNSYLIGGGNSDSTVSTFEVWQSGQKVGSGQLPVLPEDYARQLTYGNDANWRDIVIPISGQLATGAATLTIISGVDTRLPESTKYDDFEVKNLTLTTCGIGMPVFAGELP